MTKDKKKDDKKKDDKIHDDFLADDGEKATLVTKDGLARLKDELDQLKTVKRREVAARIKEAISYGDLSENSEYEEAKNEQAFVEGRIMELESKVKHAKIISEQNKATKTVQLGSTVHVVTIGKGKEEEEVYTIVGSTEADPFKGRISNESPVGAALLDKTKGDKIKVMTPSGYVEYKLEKID